MSRQFSCERYMPDISRRGVPHVSYDYSKFWNTFRTYVNWRQIGLRFHRDVGSGLGFSNPAIIGDGLAGLTERKEKSNQPTESNSETDGADYDGPEAPKRHILLSLQVLIDVILLLVSPNLLRQAFSESRTGFNIDLAFVGYLVGYLLSLAFGLVLLLSIGLIAA